MGLLTEDQRKKLAGLLSNNAHQAYQGLLNIPTDLQQINSPGMTAQVNQAMTNPQPVTEADKQSMLANGMNIAGVAPAGIFIGKGAKIWDAIAAQKAEGLLAQGVDPREVWKQTGTMRGVDKQLRQEIPDNQAMYRGSNAAGSSYLNDVYMHPSLYEAYPHLKNTRVIESPNAGGSFDPTTGKITVGPKDASSIAAHETQHGVQKHEGFAMGGSPEGMRKILGNDELASLYSPQELNDAYRRLAGETEARLTQARMNMTPEERLASYPPDMMDVPPEQQIVSGLLGENTGPALHTVYHGSPHKFDKFDMSKIGTGEGAQAYGHGLYFAEAPDVAKSYQTTLSMDSGFNFGGKSELTRNQIQELADQKYGGKYLDGVTKPSGVADRVIDDIVYGRQYGRQGELPRGYKPDSERAKAYQELMQEITHTDPGALYKVDIPDESIPKMLDWDKPLSEQPEILKTVFANGLQRSLARLHGYKNVGDFTGAELVRALGEKQATQILGKNGIPGIKYYDAMSRGTGQGTSNYVLFDDQLPRILEMNGQPTGLLSYADEIAKKDKKK